MCSEVSLAQSRWNIELRPDIDFPHQKNEGFGLEGKSLLRINRVFTTYFGWGWNLFPAEKRSAMSYEETGFTGGLQYIYPADGAGIQYFVAAGGVYSHLKSEIRDNEQANTSDNCFGWQTEAGVMIKLSDRLKIKPGLRYRNLHAVDLQYFSFGMGFLF